MKKANHDNRGEKKVVEGKKRAVRSCGPRKSKEA
jgi:hypothetical protein